MKCMISVNCSGLFTSIVETWKPITGFESNYEVSSFGQIRGIARTRLSKDGKLARVQARILKLKTSTHGYKVIGLCLDSKKHHFSVHRLVSIEFIPNKENKSTVNHKDGNKLNNNVSNLEWATSKEQIDRAISVGLVIPRGHTKYSVEFKREVLNYYETNKCSINNLASIFNISKREAGRIANRETKGLFTKLSEDQVTTIKALRDSGYTLKVIAEQMNCGISQIHRITNGLSRNIHYER